jgi:hypothetical protein
MKLYRPIKYEHAEKLKYAVGVSCGVVPAGVLVLNREDEAMRMMTQLGACLILEPAPDSYERVSLLWFKLVKEAPIVELLHKDLEQHLVDTAEHRMLGLPDATEPKPISVKRLEGEAAFKPLEETLKKFRTQNGRSPNNEELRKMSGWRK